MFDLELVKQMIRDAINKIKIFRLATVTNGKIKFDGESTESNKTYKKLNGITLINGDRVLLCNIGGTFIVLGKIT